MGELAPGEREKHRVGSPHSTIQIRNRGGIWAESMRQLYSYPYTGHSCKLPKMTELSSGRDCIQTQADVSQSVLSWLYCAASDKKYQGERMNEGKRVHGACQELCVCDWNIKHKVGWQQMVVVVGGHSMGLMIWGFIWKSMEPHFCILKYEFMSKP